ncbi:hypothetical protein B7463_g4664, partial [Scytalidium lignicola]
MDERVGDCEQRKEMTFYLHETPVPSQPQNMLPALEETTNMVQRAFLQLDIGDISRDVELLNIANNSTGEFVHNRVDLTYGDHHDHGGIVPSPAQTITTTTAYDKVKPKLSLTPNGLEFRPKFQRKTMAQIWEEKRQQYVESKRILAERARLVAEWELCLERQRQEIQAVRDRKWAERKAMGEPDSITGYKGTAFLRPARPLRDKRASRARASTSASLSAVDSAALARRSSIDSESVARPPQGQKRRREESPEMIDEYRY